MYALILLAVVVAGVLSLWWSCHSRGGPTDGDGGESGAEGHGQGSYPPSARPQQRLCALFPRRLFGRGSCTNDILLHGKQTTA